MFIINKDIKEMTAKEIVSELTTKKKDEVYRIIWKEYIKEDIILQAEELGVKLNNDVVDIIANSYVYEGDYDCNLTYWDNIENLIEKYTEDPLF